MAEHVAATPVLGLGQWAYDRGGFVRSDVPHLPLGTQALHYGTGVFEGIRSHRAASATVLFRVHDHYERMLRACRLLRITAPGSVEHLVDLTVELLRRNNHDGDTYVRPLAHKLSLLPGTPPGVGLTGVSDAWSITSHGFAAGRLAGGIRCAISSWRRSSRDAMPAQAKITGGYVTSALACDEARAAGYDDAILLDGLGNVAEASTANIFAVLGGRVVTPPATGDLLPGITRDTVITLCGESGVDVAERALGPAELITADEIFLTSTGNGIVGVHAVAGRDIGCGTTGPLTRLIASRYDDVVRGVGGAHPEWLTTVHLG
ncbi:aminotransferase class IV [Lentzea sp. HUAS12]|uniref:aminotransferase class IV n=1 Tax=Lentzea sp. HUAS12 TaxID=2951806 RepID=UPI00209D8FBE|nr:aminotransferase class IV [Lentzea sp. HUAS12]USX56279.1 aminotransferase class IV [Lentzea sp. HUAS12]